jgi:hypothetical protein
MTDAIARLLAALRSAGARIRSEKTSAFLPGEGALDDESLSVFARMSEPERTPPEAWIPGRKVHVITKNTPIPARPLELPARKPQPRSPGSRHSRERERGFSERSTS